MADGIKVRTLQALIETQLGCSVHPNVDPLISLVTTTVQRVAENNPNRVGLTFINLGAFTVYIWLYNNVGATKGIRLSANGGSVSYNWEYDMTLCGWEWFAVAVGGSSEIATIELITI
jgi:hypothetical protein